MGLRFTVHLDYSPTYTFGSLSPQCNYYQIPTPFCRFIPRAYPPLLILPMILGSIRSFSVRRQYLSENASQRANFVPLIDDVSPILRSRGFTYHIGPDGRDFRDPSHRISSCFIPLYRSPAVHNSRICCSPPPAISGRTGFHFPICRGSLRTLRWRNLIT